MARTQLETYRLKRVITLSAVYVICVRPTGPGIVALFRERLSISKFRPGNDDKHFYFLTFIRIYFENIPLPPPCTRFCFFFPNNITLSDISYRQIYIFRTIIPYHVNAVAELPGVFFFFLFTLFCPSPWRGFGP